MAVWSAGSLLVAIAGLECSVGLTLIAGGTIGSFHFLLFPLILIVAFWRCASGSSWPQSMVWGAGSATLAASLLSFALAGATFDLSPDGQTRHMGGIAHLAQGWNPIHDPSFQRRPSNYLLSPSDGSPVIHRYLATRASKGTYYAAASATRTLGSIRYGRGFNLNLILAAGLAAFAAARVIGVPRLWAILIGAVSALNPVAVGQALTNYLDGQNASLLTCLVALTVYLGYRVGAPALLGWGASLALLVSVKMSALAFAVILAIGAIIYLRWKTGLFRGLVTAAIAGPLGFFVIGFSPYVTNLSRHGGVFFEHRELLPIVIRFGLFSAVGLAALMIVVLLTPRKMRQRAIATAAIAAFLALGYVGLLPTLEAGLAGHGGALEAGEGDLIWPPWSGPPTSLRPEGRLAPWLWEASTGIDTIRRKVEIIFVSLLSASEVNPARATPKLPFRIGREELETYRALNPDLRSGGFGPWAGATVLLAYGLVGLILALRIRHRGELFAIFGLVAITVILFPDSWWARFVPQIWVLPLLVAAFGCRDPGPRLLRHAAHVVLIVMGFNCGLVFAETMRGQLAAQNAVHRTIAALRTAPNPVRVWFGGFEPLQLRLAESGIDFRAELTPCPDYVGLLRSAVRVCVEDPTAPEWRPLLDTAARIDRDLARAGMPSGFKTLSAGLRVRHQ